MSIHIRFGHPVYKAFIDQTEDSFLLEKLKEIYEDEKRHVEIAKRIIDIISE